MREPNLIQLISDRDISRIIQYLDPDFQQREKRPVQPVDVEGVMMLILLLGGVIACFVMLILHVAE
jgi:hypothetical protein